MAKRLVYSIGVLALVAALLVSVQSTVAQPAVETFDITLEAMQYDDTTVHGPSAQVYYDFYLPSGWEVLEGSYLTLVFDYKVYVREGVPYAPASLEVRLNDEHVYTGVISTPVSQQIRVILPPAAFRAPEDSRPNTIQVWFLDEHECTLDLQSQLTINKVSALHLVYRDRPLSLDLSLFPKPIFPGPSTFEQSPVRFVLPNQMEATDVRASVIIAARLGQLTYRQVPISATLASQTSTGLPQEHLIAVGKLDKNPLIGQLAKPLSLVTRRLALGSQMPMTVTAGSTLSYTLFVENTSLDAETLIVEDRLSTDTTFVACEGRCEQVAPGKLRWEVGLLAAGQAASMTLRLQATPIVTPTPLIKHTATLLDSKGNILNVDTLATYIGERADSRLIQSPQQKSSQFFVQGAQAVAEDAGILQEIVSPASARHAAIIVTGLNDEAVLKAAYGLNPQNRFPGATGPVAIVEDTRPISETVVAFQQRDLSFASQGYGNKELNVLDMASATYSFELPPATTLGEGSHLALHVAHAAILTKVNGAIKVFLNGIPIGSARLDDSNVSDAWLKIPLSKAALQSGLNRVRVQPTIDRMELCLIRQYNPYWLTVFSDSFFHVEYKQAQARFDLKNFPYPYNWPGDMKNLVFALSATPTLTETEETLRLAYGLGSYSPSKDLLPRVVLGQASNLSAVAGSHIIAIGLPTTNVLIRSANAFLPQPFVPGTNDVYQSIDKPIYGVPPGTVLGLVQQFISPWSTEEGQAFLAVTGTTEEGVRWAAASLVSPVYELKGDLAVVRDDKIFSIDTRPVNVTESVSTTVSLVPTSQETKVPAATPTPQPAPTRVEPTVLPTRVDSQPEPVSSSRPMWLVALLVVSVLTLVLFITLEIRKARS